MSGLLYTDAFVFFWAGWPSQWHKAPFELDGHRYVCCEQFMMAEKARVFGDADAEAAILRTNNPREQKALGRKVRGFDGEVWSGVCRGIVYRANLAKFEQNPRLAEELLRTGERTIVEASPRDRIWGIGLHRDDSRAHDPSQWRGTNWLGVALMQARDALRRRRGEEAPPMDEELSAQLARREALRSVTRSRQ